MRRAIINNDDVKPHLDLSLIADRIFGHGNDLAVPFPQAAREKEFTAAVSVRVQGTEYEVWDAGNILNR